MFGIAGRPHLLRRGDRRARSCCFCVGTFGCGFYAAAHNSYRFAAADTASDAFKPKAISWVLAGGVMAGIIGPQVVIVTKDWWLPHLFAATYLAQVGAGGARRPSC